MLSPVIKQLLENRLGKEIRYPANCEHLAFDIEKQTNQHVGVNTLKRLLGYIEGVKEPRLFTLDIIARYIGFKNWDELLDDLNLSGNSGFSTIEEIEIKNLSAGDKISFCYSPDRKVTIEYLEKNLFRVAESLNGKLQEGDIIEVNHFVLNYPLLVSNVERNGVMLGKFTAGKVSGITNLNLINNVV